MSNIKDVAKEAGIAVATVSRVLNNRGYISEKTKKKVNDAMALLDYKPNEIARSLYRKKSNIIGVIVPSVAHPFFSALVNDVEFYAYQFGYKVLICNSLANIEKERNYLELINRNQVDGFLAFIITDNSSEYIKPEMPIIMFDRHIAGIPYISSDHTMGGLLATKLLISKGCKKIVHFSAEIKFDTLSNLRSKAYMDEMAKHNIEYYIEQTNFTDFEHYQENIESFLKEHPDIDGVFASSDIIAAAVIRVSDKLGISIPDQLKVVGYDDIELAMITHPTITTIHQDIREISKLAVKLLIDKIDGKEVPLETVLPVALIERSST